VGAVYKVTVSGQESVVYSFKGGSDGQLPFDALVDVNGTLYGTTELGGTYGRGTIFAISNSKESVAYSFGKVNTDSLFPTVALLNVNGTLYGTSASGGTKNDGTVFAYTP
jgi:uncharacterized repeat protein (TIGR03803 family)